MPVTDSARFRADSADGRGCAARGEQPSGADGAAVGQRGEAVAVSVRGELPAIRVSRALIWVFTAEMLQAGETRDLPPR